MRNYPSLQKARPCACSNSCGNHSCSTNVFKPNVISKPSNEFPSIFTINLDSGRVTQCPAMFINLNYRRKPA